MSKEHKNPLANAVRPEEFDLSDLTDKDKRTYEGSPRANSTRAKTGQFVDSSQKRKEHDRI